MANVSCAHMPACHGKREGMSTPNVKTSGLVKKCTERAAGGQGLDPTVLTLDRSVHKYKE